jgi:Na+/phosphate symporter
MPLILWPLLVALAGLVLYRFAKDARVSEVGRILFFVGAFWLTYLLAGSTLHLGR